MEYLLYGIGLFLLVIVAIYFLSPRTYFNLFRDMLRRRGKLSQKSVQVGDLTWPYLEGGKADGEPLVLIHGFGGDKDNWAMYAPEVIGKYRLFCPDLPGFGENTRDSSLSYDMTTQAARVRDFLDAMGIEKCHIGGNSMGGFVSLRFAVDFPERLRSLTLFNNAGVVGEGESELQKQAIAGINPLQVHSPEDVKRMLAFVMHKPPALPGQFRKIAYADFNQSRELWDSIFWTLVEDGLNNPLNDKLSGIETPTMIIWGRHDQLIDVSCVKVLDEGIPNSEAVIFEDVGHIPMIEKPKAVAEHHLPFLAKH